MFMLRNCAACQNLPTLHCLSKSYYPLWSYCPFYQFFSILIPFLLYFRNYKRQMLSLITKICSMLRSTYPANFKKIPLPILVLLPFFNQILKILIFFFLYFRNYKRQKLRLIAKLCSMSRYTHPAIFKHIPLPIMELLPFFPSNFQNVNTFRPLFKKTIRDRC